MPAPILHLVSHDLSSEDLDSLARQWGGMAAEGRPRLVVSPAFGPLSLEEAIASSSSGAVEVEIFRALCPSPRLIGHLARGGIGMAVSTGTAYNCDAALIFSNRLRALWPEWAAAVPNLDGVIHELVSNALVHGNLDVASPRHDMDGFDRYCANLDRALADKGKLARRLELSGAISDGALEVCIQDEGPGYRFHRIIEAESCAEPRQHGLAIIDQAARRMVDDGGRRTILRFGVPA